MGGSKSKSDATDGAAVVSAAAAAWLADATSEVADRTSASMTSRSLATSAWDGGGGSSVPLAAGDADGVDSSSISSSIFSSSDATSSDPVKLASVEPLLTGSSLAWVTCSSGVASSPTRSPSMASPNASSPDKPPDRIPSAVYSGPLFGIRFRIDMLELCRSSAYSSTMRKRSMVRGFGLATEAARA